MLTICAGVALLIAGCAAPSLPTDWWSFFTPRQRGQAAPIVLTVAAWPGFPDEDAWLHRTLDELDQLNPAIEIDVTLAPASSPDTKAADDGPLPDVIMVSGFALPDLVAKEQLSEIDTGIAVEDIAPNLQPGFTIEGKPYCFPQSVNALALYFNRAMFDDAGLAYPDADWTWSELGAAAEALTDPNLTAFGFVMPADLSRWLPFYFAAGGQVPPDHNLSLDPGAAHAATEFLAGLFVAGNAAAPDATASDWSGEAFGKGRAGMVIEGTWLASYLAQKYPRIDYGVAELPTGRAGRGSVLFTTCIGVSAASAHADLAHALAGQLSHPQSLSARGQASLDLPPYASMLVDWETRHPELQPFADGLTYGHLWQLGRDQATPLQTFNSRLQAAFAGDIDAAEAVSRFPFVASSPR